MESYKLKLLAESLQLQARIESLNKWMQDKGSTFAKQPDDLKIAQINRLMAMQTYQQNLDYIIGKIVSKKEMLEFQQFSEAQAAKVKQEENEAAH